MLSTISAACNVSGCVCRVVLEDPDEMTLFSVPPLDLDFSGADDVTSRSAVTPKAGSSKSKAGKKVRYDEESLRSTARSKSAPPGGVTGREQESARSKTPSPGRSGRKDRKKKKTSRQQ